MQQIFSFIIMIFEKVIYVYIFINILSLKNFIIIFNLLLKSFIFRSIELFYKFYKLY
jgi:hypothetical protein